MRQLKIGKQITNRESPSFVKYLQEIGKESLINVDEEVRLARKIRDGDQKALEKMVKANLRFVVSVAKQYQNQGLSLPDLINEGNLGLIKAAKRFDETRGFKFISYAVWWIRQSILQALAEQSRMVRLPLNKIGYINKINRASSRLEQDFEREPTNQEISELLERSKGLKISEDAIKHTQKSAGKTISLDAPFVIGEDNTLLDVMPGNEENNPMAELFMQSLRKEIERALAGALTPREADVVKLYFGLIPGQLNMTLEEIGEKFDLTRERVRQIKEKAILRLRKNSKSKLLRTYLG